jgi:hypothetical protein
MTFLLLLLCAVIYTYGHVTDATRVRVMAETYLSRLVGGRVVVGRAYLSIFEGLRLDDVEVHVDPANAPLPGRGDAAPDSLLFSAKTFVIKYDPKSMLGGTLEATQIIVQKPSVHLTENVDTGEWNWYRVVRRRGGKGGVGRSTLSPSPPPKLPEILLRNAKIEFSEIRSGRFSPLAFLAVDGQLGPGDDGERYNFDLQSRGVSEMGPSVSGWVSLTRGQVSAKLMNFSFGPDVRSMLPVDVRQWWERHDLSGRIDIPVLSYVPAREGRPQSFRVETVIVDGVALTVRAEEWMGSNDVRKLNRTRESLAMMRDVYRAAGYKVQPQTTRAKPRDAGGTATAARPRDADRTPAMIDVAAACLEPTPLKLENVAGKFVFTQDGVSIESLSGRVDNNGIKINGRIDGYTPEAPVALKVTSFTTENLTIPASPRYIASLPAPVREFYEQLRPEGTCRLTVEVSRTTAGAMPEISGKLDIINGKFLYSKFPYPLREVSGRVVFGRDPATGADRVEIQQVRGRGMEDGPNRNTWIQVDGRVSPIGPTSGVNIRVTSDDAASEEALRLAFPPEVRKALTIFDPGGKGEFPKYRGKFVCDIVRPPGVRTPWSFDTDITLTDGAGKLEAFPYPLEHVKGDLKIRTGHVDIVNLRFQRTGAELSVNGRVSWGREADSLLLAQGQTLLKRDAPGEDGSNVVTDLKVTALNVPIDKDLLEALPPDRRGWLEQIGISGTLDIEGRVYQGINARRSATPAERATFTPLDYDLDVTLRDGTLWPTGSTFAVSKVDAKLLLSRQTLSVLEAKGKRGNAELSGAARIEWTPATAAAPVGAGAQARTGTPPRVWLSARAKGLALETPLYAALPEAVRKAWDELQPQGTLDVDISYDNAANGLASAASAKDGRPPPPQPFAVVDATSLLSPVDVIDLTAAPPKPALKLDGLKAVLKPRELSVMLQSVPYRLDHVTGTVTVLPDKVLLEDVAAVRGDATVRVSGTGVVGGRGLWDLKLAAENVPVDDELRRALPATISDVFTSLEVQGKIGFDFTRFIFRGAEVDANAPKAQRKMPGSPKPATAKARGEPREPGPDVDLAGTVTLSGTDLDVGVPLTNVRGKFIMSEVVVRNGKPIVATGEVTAKSMVLAGRTMENFRAGIVKPPGRDELRFEKMRGQMCRGLVGGGVTLVFPPDDQPDEPSRYAINLAVRNADVAELTSETEKSDMKGELTASLSLEGSWGAAAVRRGRGDVLVVGRGMYRVPLILGLLQVTNLALPISGPFNEATARYSVDGERITFDSIDLRSNAMVMSGDGHLDFGTKEVRLSFQTDNPKGLKVPFLDDLLRGARHELLKIYVHGTIQEPKVSAGVMGTFTTTVDNVIRGDAAPARPKAKKRK